MADDTNAAGTSDLPPGFVPWTPPAQAAVPPAADPPVDPTLTAAFSSIKDPAALSMAANAASSAGLPAAAIPAWVSAIHNESGWNLNERDGDAGEIGPGQVKPETGADMGFSVDQLRDPQQNLTASAKYFAKQWADARGQDYLALTGYNAGNVRAQPGDYAAKAMSRLMDWSNAPTDAVPPPSSSDAASASSDLPPGFIPWNPPSQSTALPPGFIPWNPPPPSTAPAAAAADLKPTESPDAPVTPFGPDAIDIAALSKNAPAASAPPVAPKGALDNTINAGAQGAATGSGQLFRGAGEEIGAAGYGANRALVTAEANAQGRPQLAVMDRIDAGLPVSPAGTPPGYDSMTPDQRKAAPALPVDVFGYADMTPDQRQTFRAQFEQQLKAMPAPEATPLGMAGAALNSAGQAVQGAAASVGNAIGNTAAQFPVDPAEEGRATKIARALGSFAPVMVAGLTSGGIAAVAGVIGTQSFDGTYQDAISHGADQGTAYQAATINGLLQAGIMSVPMSGALLKIADPLVQAGALKTVVNLAAHDVHMVTASQAGKFVDNYVASQTYDPTRNPMDGLGKDIDVDVALGLVVPAMHEAANLPAAMARTGIEASPELQNAVGGISSEIARAQSAPDAVPASPEPSAPPEPTASPESTAAPPPPELLNPVAPPTPDAPVSPGAAEVSDKLADITAAAEPPPFKAATAYQGDTAMPALQPDPASAKAEQPAPTGNPFVDAAEESPASVRAYNAGAKIVADRLGLSPDAAAALTRGQVEDATLATAGDLSAMRTDQIRQQLRAAEPDWAQLPAEAKDARVRLADTMQTFMQFAGLPKEMGLRLVDQIAGGAADGRYDPIMKSIDFAMDTDWAAAPQKFFHEVMHPMLDLLPQGQKEAVRGEAYRWLTAKTPGALDPSNRAYILRTYADQANAVGGWKSNAGQQLLLAEAVSHMAEQTMGDLFTPKPGVVRSIGSVGRVMDRIGNFFVGEGWQTGHDVIRSILQGDKAAPGSAERLRTLAPRGLPMSALAGSPLQPPAQQDQAAESPNPTAPDVAAPTQPAPAPDTAAQAAGETRPAQAASPRPPVDTPAPTTDFGKTTADLLAPRDPFKLGPARESLDGSISGAADSGAYYSLRDPERVPGLPGFYSPVARAALDLKQERGSGEQMLAMLTKTSGVKPEEMRWLGVDRWLRQIGTDKVTRDQIVDYIRANSLDVREVLHGPPADDQESSTQENAKLDRLSDLVARDGGSGTRLSSDEREELNRLTEELGTSEEGGQPTRYQSYALPEGQKYRELLITLPEKGKPEDYANPHWDEKNVVAHTRFTERVADDGARTLMIEEAQSDWHQDGRKNGYRSTPRPPEPEPIEKWGASRGLTPDLIREAKASFVDREPNETYLAWSRENAERTSSLSRWSDGTVPEAPFKTTWPSLLMKRMVRWAIDNGFDRVAWSPGEVHADRYGVDAAGMRGFYDKILPAETNKLIGKFGSKVERTTIPQDNPAHRIDLSGAPNDGKGNGQPEKVRAPVHSFDVTPAMREAVLNDGMPLFSLRETMERLGGNAMEAGKSWGEEMRRVFVPIATGSPFARASAARYANFEREISTRFNLWDQQLQKRFTAPERRLMWEAMDDQSLFELELRDQVAQVPREEEAAFVQQARERFAGEGLDRLSPEQRDVVIQLDAAAKRAWEEMRVRGMLDNPEAEGLPFYSPRFFVDAADPRRAKRLDTGSGPIVKAIDPLGLNLSTNGPRPRDIKITADSLRAMRANYPGADLVRDIRVLPVMLAREQRAIAGADLVRAIKRYGEQMGLTLVSHAVPSAERQNYVTIPHPALTEQRPRMVEGPDGTREQAIGANGVAIYDTAPLLVHSDFEGPLKAILTKPPAQWYRSLMALKRLSVGTIMYSPLVHLQVELGRTFPMMKFKLGSMAFWQAGNKMRMDPDYMSDAIMHGLAPIGGSWASNVTDIYNEPNLTPGFFRKIGDGWHALHQKVLWDRIQQMQVGIYDTMRQRYIADGFEPGMASYMAAHLANRYAGALPQEALSRAANIASNIAMFSRSYTLGNLGAIKDMTNGMPSYVRAQMEQEFTPDQVNRAKSVLRRKAISAFVWDVALFYVGNSLLQDGMHALLGDDTLDRWAKSYVGRYMGEVNEIAKHPWKFLNLFGVMQSLTSSGDNEPGKENRIGLFTDSTGQETYLRNPVGKVGEDFAGWFTNPVSTLRNKLSPMLRSAMESLMNTGSFGRPVYDEHGSGWQIAGSILQHLVVSQFPVDQAAAFFNSVKGAATGTNANELADTMKWAGPTLGLQFSHGFPGGPVQGGEFARQQAAEFARREAYPNARSAFNHNDEAGARRILTEQGGMNDAQVSRAIASMSDPTKSQGARDRAFNKAATDPQQQRLDAIRQNVAPPAFTPKPAQPPPAAAPQRRSELTPAQTGRQQADDMFRRAGADAIGTA